MIVFTDNPERDADRHDAEQEKWLKSRPVCAVCEEHIQEESAVYIGDSWICDECIDSLKRFID